MSLSKQHWACTADQLCHCRLRLLLVCGPASLACNFHPQGCIMVAASPGITTVFQSGQMRKAERFLLGSFCFLCSGSNAFPKDCCLYITGKKGARWLIVDTRDPGRPSVLMGLVGTLNKSGFTLLGRSSKWNCIGNQEYACQSIIFKI